MYPEYKHLSAHGRSIDDQLTVWSYQHTSRITRRGCGRKGQFHDDSIADTTIDYNINMGNLALELLYLLDKYVLIRLSSSKIEQPLVLYTYTTKLQSTSAGIQR